MNMSNQDLDWVAAQRPQVPGGDREAHDRALLALLRHASSRPAARRGGITFGSLTGSRLRMAAIGTGVAAITAAVVLSAGGGNAVTSSHGSSQTLQAAVSHSSTKSSLTKLANDVGATNDQAGNATLVQRTTHTDGQDVTVYDLYTDSGTYYFSSDESGLAGQVSSGHSLAGGLFGREVAAAKEAADGDVQQGGMDMAKAPDPSSSVNPKQAVNWAAVEAKLKGLEAAGDKQAAAELLAGPSAEGTLYDNWAWEDSEDALVAGSADPEVRAGVLKILATLPGVTVAHGSSDGQPTLVLSSGSKETGVGYTEQLTINADNGEPMQLAGDAAVDPAPTVDYQVRRVTLSDIAAGQLPSFQ